MKVKIMFRPDRLSSMVVKLGARIKRQYTDDQRFWEKVRKNEKRNLRVGTPCWVWTAGVNAKGYGRFGVIEWFDRNTFRKDGKRTNVGIMAHHYLWCKEQGRRVAPGMTLDHRCRNKLCVRPNHLEEVTIRVNSQRRIADAGNPNPYCVRESA